MDDGYQVGIKEYVERILNEKEKTTMLVASSLELRLEHLNELRKEVERDRDIYVHRSVFQQVSMENDRRIGQLETTQARMIGIAIAIVALAGFLGFVAGKLFK